MSINLWDEERKTLYRELVQDYIDEGYDKQEAQRMAKAEVVEMFGSEERDVYNLADKLFE